MHTIHSCSLFAYIGSLLCKAYILEGLERLEFRGYDAAGFACFDIHTNSICSIKKTGKVAELKERALALPCDGYVGIGHTRWATHGASTEQNAHPHASNDARFIMVHNGVIENFLELKTELLAQGYTFVSQTDSEVIAHLFDRAYKKSNDLIDAARETLQQLHGACTFIGLHKEHPHELIVARQRSPLCIGVAPDGMSIASEPIAFADTTNTVYFLPERTIALVTRDSIKAYDYDGNPLAINVQQIEQSPAALQKLDHEHFMLKEIHEQRDALYKTVAYCQEHAHDLVRMLALTAADIQNLTNITLFGCGASWHAACIGSYFFEHSAQLPTSTHCASELRDMPLFPSLQTLYIAVSQSGQTGDTLELVRALNRHNMHTIALTNAATSSLHQEARGGMVTQAGPELSVAATKTFTTQLALLYWLAHYIAHQRGTIDAAQMAAAADNLLSAADILEQMIATYMSEIIALAQQYARSPYVLYVARHINHPFALEAALKLKEVSYVAAEGYPAGELKHGGIVMVDEQTPCILFSHQDPSVYTKLVSNAHEIKARKGRLVAFAFEGQDELIALADKVFIMPRVAPLLEPIAMAGLMQLFAYYVGLTLGRDIDRPRNLAKTGVIKQ
jgi:glucosamine--fructose-6-phosphate aminotransferase (isomerizing)